MPEFTSTGTPTFNANPSYCTIDAGDEINGGPAALLDPVQGWVAVRLAPSWAAVAGGAPSGAGARVFSWGVTTAFDNELTLYVSTISWNMLRGTDPVAGTTTTHAAGDHITLIGAWTAATVLFSLNGGAFASQPNATIPAVTATPFSIGNGSYVGDASAEIYADIYWLALGKGVLADADAATINGYGDTDPKRGTFPITAQCQFVWPAASTRYDIDSGASFIPSWKRRPVPMIKGPDTDRLAGMKGRFAR